MATSPPTFIKIIKTKPNFGGLALALVFWWASLSPSLLPRPWYLQLFISGLSTAIGYGLGCFFSMIIRGLTHSLKIPEPPLRLRRLLWQCLLAAAIVIASVSLGLSRVHQRELRQLMGLPPEFAFNVYYILIGALMLSLILVLISRIIRRFGQHLQRRLDRFLPEPIADVLTIALVAGFLIGVVGNLMYHRAFSYANSTFRQRDLSTKLGDVRPLSASRSGGPGSLASWQTLGKQGRDFVSSSTSAADLQRFSNKPPMEPIRVYAGLRSANTIQAEADLVVSELDRTGAFNRSVLCIATTTGTGWIDPDAPKALEYMFNGNSAIAGLQYSYLPSWISFLADRNKAALASQILINTVYRRWQQLPADHRPKLVLFGESLGAFGSQSDFSNASDIVHKTDGVLWVGPPNASHLWRQLTVTRDSGSPAWRPIYQAGRTVRFAAQPRDLQLPSGTWTSPHVVYLQHASDPVVWLDTQLLYRRPAWLKTPRGYDVSSHVKWYPLVSWGQMVVDLAIAGNVPSGHGHVYNGDIFDSMAAAAQPPNWSAKDTQHLHQFTNE